MKNVLSVLLAITLLALGLTACGSAGSDLEYVQEKGTLVVGITDFAPMDYQDADGNWIGFDADMAKAFAEELGVKVQFQIIEWDNKAFELEGKRIMPVVENGYAVVAISHGGEQSLIIRGRVSPRWVAANSRVRADMGCVALMYGPYVYCLEEMDNGPLFPNIFV